MDVMRILCRQVEVSGVGLLVQKSPTEQVWSVLV
jgi:hypothetical protein